jgi:hypothetical protein
MSARQRYGSLGTGEPGTAGDVVTPNDYVLGTNDEQVSVTYSTYGIVGPSLTYHQEADPTGVGTYAGNKVRTEQSELGDLITVTIEEVPDARRRTLTLLVPMIVLDPDQAVNGVRVEALVLWTTTIGDGKHGGRSSITRSGE